LYKWLTEPYNSLTMQRYILVRVLLLFSAMFLFLGGFSQNRQQKWNDTQSLSYPAVEGQVGEKANSPYLRFVTDATNITIRFKIDDGASLSASSDVLLYGLDYDGNWLLLKGTQQPGDTITQIFNTPSTKRIEYRLFLPPAQRLPFVKIGVPEGANLQILPLQPEKKVFVYKKLSEDRGVLPAETWQAKLERITDRPVVTFAQGDHAKLLAHISSAELKAIFLDVSAYLPNQDPKKQIASDISKIRKYNKILPIFLVTGGKEIESGNLGLVISGLQSITTNLFVLPITDKPNDTTFESIVREHLLEPKGQISTTIPVTQSRDGNYNWRQRHTDELLSIKQNQPKNVIFANSIINYWGGEPVCTIARGKDSWDNYLKPLSVQNMGFGWDRIENVLWRVYHDELDGFKPNHILLMIGTNNLQSNTDSDIVAGLANLIEAIKIRQPGSKILISGIFPRRKMEERVLSLNQSIERMAGAQHAEFINPGRLLLNENGKIKEELFGGDGLHPNAVGYGVIAPDIASHLKSQ
jgi:hypothetical protein